MPALARVTLKIHAGLYTDETANHADWHLPLSHPLESWGDARAFDGTISMIQPTVAPLYDTRSAAEVLATITEPEPRDGLAIDAERSGGTGAARRRSSPAGSYRCATGSSPGSAFPPETVRAPPARVRRPRHAATDTGGIDLLIRPDPSVWDGVVRQCRLAAGTAQAADQDHLGQSGLDQPPPRRAAASRERRDRRGRGRRAAHARAGLDHAGTGGRRGHRHARIWPRQRRQRRRRGRVRRLCAAPGRLAVAGGGCDACAAAAAAQSLATTQDHATMEGHDFVRVQRVGAPPAGDKTAFTQPTLYPQARQRRPLLGHGDRYRCLHRLQRLRHRLPGGEQRRGRRPRAGAWPGAGCTGCASTATTRDRSTRRRRISCRSPA